VTILGVIVMQVKDTDGVFHGVIVPWLIVPEVIVLEVEVQ